MDDDAQADGVDAALILQREAGVIGSLPGQPNGDVNTDGRLDSTDASLILQFVAGVVDQLSCAGGATAGSMQAALILRYEAGLPGSQHAADIPDANGDDVVNSVDASLILQRVAGR